jgi:hypothetical protein
MRAYADARFANPFGPPPCAIGVADDTHAQMTEEFRIP